MRRSLRLAAGLASTLAVLSASAIIMLSSMGLGVLRSPPPGQASPSNYLEEIARMIGDAAASLGIEVMTGAVICFGLSMAAVVALLLTTERAKRFFRG